MPKKWIFLISIIIAFFSYYYYTKAQSAKDSNRRTMNSSNDSIINNAYTLLQNGDVIFRKGADGISDLFVGMNQKDKRYSHCGIYLQTDTAGYVYHSIGGEDNPDEKIRKEVFTKFIEPQTNLAFGIYRFHYLPAQLHRLDSVVKLWHAQKRTFDMDFSLTNDDTKLYCVEFVVKAIEIAVADSTYFSRSKIATKSYEYVAPDDVLLNKNIEKIIEYSFIK